MAGNALHRPNGEVGQKKKTQAQKPSKRKGLTWSGCRKVPVQQEDQNSTSNYQQWIDNYKQTSVYNLLCASMAS
ncbi:mannonate dehydratase [Vibrio chagasii]|nr:mannonate dehydratase [Vibrio chagasii]